MPSTPGAHPCHSPHLHSHPISFTYVHHHHHGYRHIHIRGAHCLGSTRRADNGYKNTHECYAKGVKYISPYNECAYRRAPTSATRKGSNTSVRPIHLRTGAECDRSCLHASTSCEGCDRSCSHASNHSSPPSEIASGRVRAIPCNCMGGNTYGVSCVRRHPDFCRIDVFVIRTTIATKRRCFEVQQRRVRQELLACLNSQRRVRQELLACLKAQLSPFLRLPL